MHGRGLSSALRCFSYPHAQREQGKVIDVGVHIYMLYYICLWTKKNLNRTLAIDSPFQTFAVGLLVKFIGLQHNLTQNSR